MQECVTVMWTENNMLHYREFETGIEDAAYYACSLPESYEATIHMGEVQIIVD